MTNLVEHSEVDDELPPSVSSSRLRAKRYVVDATLPLLLDAFRALLAAGSREEILRALLDNAMGEAHASGAAVVELRPDGVGAVVLAAPPSLVAWEERCDGIDAGLGARLLARAGAPFTVARTLAIASDHVAFGALVLLFDAHTVPGPTGLAIVEALATLAALELDKDRQRAELTASRELLERTDKLRGMGEMAAGISHDLKNILNPLSLHLQLLRRMLKRGEAGAAEVVDEMARVLQRGVETVDRLRAFSRSSPETPVEAVALDGIAHEAIEICRPRIASRHRTRGIRLVERFGAPPAVASRPAELVAALVNLVANAMDAMVDGGTVTVSTGTSDGGAWVEVADDGPGIPFELQARVFEPFFTTKGQAGTGLGLAMVVASVRRYGGKITLETGPGRGASFRLWFPCVAVSA